jgi:hypothetical protein
MEKLIAWHRKSTSKTTQVGTESTKFTPLPYHRLEKIHEVLFLRLKEKLKNPVLNTDIKLDNCYVHGQYDWRTVVRLLRGC